MLRKITATILCTALLAPAALAQEPIFGFGRAPVQGGNLSEKVHAAHYLPDVEDYTEYWTHAFVFKSGHVLFARFVVTNLGPGDNKGAVQAHLITPDGEVHTFIDGRRDRSWSYSTERLDMKLAKHALSGDGKSFQMRLGNDEGATVDLAISNAIDGYRVGRILYGGGKQDYLDFTVTSPRATAKGTFSAGGKSVDLDGVGYADHLYTNYAQHKQCSSWITFAGFTDDLTVNLTNVVTTKAFGFRRVPFLAVGRAGAIAFTANKVSVSQSRFWRDRKSKAKYRVPRLLRISAKGPKAGDVVRVRAVVKRRLHRFDILGGLAPFERFVVERIAKPMQYRFLADFTIEGQVGGEKIKGEGQGLIEVIHINPR
jgi:hypothetical protein